jgi:hypothetical protein
MSNDTVTVADVANRVMYESAKPFVNDDGIYVPCNFNSNYYKLLISKELFVEAYNKWIADEKKYD